MQTTEVHRIPGCPLTFTPEVIKLQNKRQDPCGHGNLKGTFQTITWYFFMSSHCLNADLMYSQKKAIHLTTGKAFKFLKKKKKQQLKKKSNWNIHFPMVMCYFKRGIFSESFPLFGSKWIKTKDQMLNSFTNISCSF